MNQAAQNTTQPNSSQVTTNDPVYQRDLSDREKLNIMDQVIDSVSQGFLGQGGGNQTNDPNMTNQSGFSNDPNQSRFQQSQQPYDPAQHPTRSSRERSESTVDRAAEIIDGGGGLQGVEHERTPEIPVEVESFLHRVEDHQDSAPEEIVVADGTTETDKASYPSKPVLVLPFTQEEEKIGAKKPPTSSFRWLIEFGKKITKMFFGKVIYKD